MSDFEQRTEEYGTAILKLVRVKETAGSNTRLFGNIVFSMKHYKEGDSEIMLVRIIPISSNAARPIKSTSGNASDQLSINKIYALVNHRSNSIEFGPTQGLFLDKNLRNKGIGTFAFNELIMWLRENFQEYSITPFDFVTGDNVEDDEREMRNKFLENFGFTLGFTDVTQRNGTMKAKKPSLLKCYTNTEKLEEVDIEKFFFNLLNERNKLEKEYSELKIEYAARGEELLGGMPKGDLIKYTVIGSIAVLVIMLLLIL